MRTLIFTYGTLQSEMIRDLNRLAQLEGQGIIFKGSAISVNQYHCFLHHYSFPYLSPLLSGVEYIFGYQGFVKGEVYEVPLSFVDTTLDSIEGYDKETKSGLFIRSFDYFTLENGEVVKALVYIKGDSLEASGRTLMPSYLGETLIADFNLGYYQDLYGSRDDSKEVVFDYKKLVKDFFTIKL